MNEIIPYAVYIAAENARRAELAKDPKWVKQIADIAAMTATDKVMQTIASTGKKCKRCGGTGVLVAYRHVEGGRCFGCTR